MKKQPTLPLPFVQCLHRFKEHGCKSKQCVLRAGHGGAHKCKGDRRVAVDRNRPA